MSSSALRGARATTVPVETTSRRKLEGDLDISSLMASIARPITVRGLPLRLLSTLSQSLACETTSLYDTAKLDVYDKYAMFLHGNNGLSRIKGDGTGRVLVIKDSYANCFVPYLTANYADIDVVDFRNYNSGLDKLIADNDYDQLLVLYSFDSFKSDPYLYRAGVAG